MRIQDPTEYTFTLTRQEALALGNTSDPEHAEVLNDLICEIQARCMADIRRTRPTLLTTRQAAERLYLSERTVRRRCLQGIIPAKRVGKCWFISSIDVAAMAV